MYAMDFRASKIPEHILKITTKMGREYVWRFRLNEQNDIIIEELADSNFRRTTPVYIETLGK